MDIRILIFVAIFVLLLMIGRKLSSASEVHAASLPVPDIGPENSPEAAPDGGQARERVTGAEIDFPVPVAPVQRLADGSYNRPYILNYHFGKTDLLRGPDDPASFFDELFILTEDPATRYQWTYDYTVATPSGIKRVLDEEKFDSLFFDGRVVLVQRWDLRVIMQTVMEEFIKSYSHQPHTGAERSALAETGSV